MMTHVELLVLLLFGGDFSTQSAPPTEQDPLAAKVSDGKSFEIVDVPAGEYYLQLLGQPPRPGDVPSVWPSCPSSHSH